MAISANTYKNLTIVIPEPLTGPGGQALNNNFKYIADQLQALNNNQLTKISPATAGNLPKLLSSGLLEDSGIAASVLDDVINIPTEVNILKNGYFLINQGDGSTDWENVGALGTGITVSDIDTTSETVDTIDETLGNAVTWEYVVRNNTTNGNLRAGFIQAVWEPTEPDSEVEFYEYSTNDIGDTSPLTFNVTKNDSADIIELIATVTSDNWDVKLFRKILAF